MIEGFFRFLLDVLVLGKRHDLTGGRMTSASLRVMLASCDFLPDAPMVTAQERQAVRKLHKRKLKRMAKIVVMERKVSNG